MLKIRGVTMVLSSVLKSVNFHVLELYTN